MKRFIVLPSLLILLGTVWASFFSSCNAGEANGVNAQPSLFVPAPDSPMTVAGGSSNVVLGDMNKDGRLDLIVAGGPGRVITVLLGGGDGRFRGTGARSITVSADPVEMVLGDLNGDSLMDLAFASHDSYAVTILLGDGKGALALAPNSPIVMKEGQHPHTHGLGLGDLNGDGKVDLATVNNSDNDVSIAFGDGRGGFTRASASPFAVGPSPYPLALGDVNNDGRPDIVATSTATGPQRAQQLSSSRALTLLLADGGGGFQTSQLPLRTGQPWFVAVADLNGDRKADLVATHHEQSAFTVLIGNGQGRFTEAAGSPFDFGHDVWQIALSDVNRDGKSDVIAAAGDGVRVMLGDGRGGFTSAPHSPFLTGRGTWRLSIGDVNSDGKLDVVAGNAEGNTVSVLLGQ